MRVELMPLIWGAALVVGIAVDVRPARSQQAELRIETVVPYPGAALAYAFDHLWAISGGRLLRINPRDASVSGFDLPGGEASALLSDADRYRGIATGEGAIWLADVGLSKLLKLDPVSGAVRLIIPTDIFGSAGSVGVGEGSVWILTFDSRDRTLVRYHSSTGHRQATVALPEPGVGVLVSEGSVWVTAASRPELYRIDPRADSVVATIPLLAPSRSLAATPLKRQSRRVSVTWKPMATLPRMPSQSGQSTAIRLSLGSTSTPMQWLVPLSRRLGQSWEGGFGSLTVRSGSLVHLSSARGRPTADQRERKPLPRP